MIRSKLILRSEGKAPALFINAASSNTINMTKPSGILSGDIAIIIRPPASSDRNHYPVTAGGGTWSLTSNVYWSTYGYLSQVYHKVLNATDISNVWRWDDVLARTSTVLVYRGSNAISVAYGNNSLDGSNTFSTPGFTPAANSVGVLSFCADRDGPSANLTISNTFVTRYSNTAEDTFYYTKYVDQLSGYSGANIEWTGLLGTSGFGESVINLELLKN